LIRLPLVRASACRLAPGATRSIGSPHSPSVRASRSPTDKQESKYRWGVAAQDIDLSSCHSLREGDPSERADDDDNQRRRAPDGERDKGDRGRGSDRPVRAWRRFDELTHFTAHQFFYMVSRNRSTIGRE
jgi:hypothetical protein